MPEPPAESVTRVRGAGKVKNMPFLSVSLWELLLSQERLLQGMILVVLIILFKKWEIRGFRMIFLIRSHSFATSLRILQQCSYFLFLRLHLSILGTRLDHRIFATTTLFSIGALWLATKKLDIHSAIRSLIGSTVGMAALLVTLGISALLSYVPVSLGSAHKAGALTLLTHDLA
ncbi:hypothetical protein Ddye_026854 [Dipteronia dyeriana]|uniref:Uncharacterized protein n=1 Tax=Dipteronia dyeriana TaxID=168575 RepID=A0AAD9WPN0_9ROSI|nr:hypothetical protein Ddye_026854 [Dipteronia dyeriana]